MGDMADVYEETRTSIRDLLDSRPPADLERPAPATPGWRVRDVVAHLIGDLESIPSGDFPAEFFDSFGDETAIGNLNRWTTGHVEKRARLSYEELLKEWDERAAAMVLKMRGEEPWPERVPPFVDRVLITDLGVHQQDIYGAFGIERDREGPPVKIGVAGYIAIIGLRLQGDGGGTIAFEAPGKRWVVGNGEDPDATIRASRFELFRALSGRRSPEQVRAYDWTGDPEPFIQYFYPYGVRTEALVE